MSPMGCVHVCVCVCHARVPFKQTRTSQGTPIFVIGIEIILSVNLFLIFYVRGFSLISNNSCLCLKKSVSHHKGILEALCQCPKHVAIKEKIVDFSLLENSACNIQLFSSLLSLHLF